MSYDVTVITVDYDLTCLHVLCARSSSLQSVEYQVDSIDNPLPRKDSGDKPLFPLWFRAEPT